MSKTAPSTLKLQVHTCKFCHQEIRGSVMPAKDRDDKTVGFVHAGYCAMQWRAQINGTAGFFGFLGC